MPLRISNRDARRLWLDAQLLSEMPTGPLDLIGTIRRLGLVQLDTIRVIARAHHHILWSRNQHYRAPMLYRMMREERNIFEHFTHDASILPIEMYPMWRRRMQRLGDWMVARGWLKNMPDESERAAIMAKIATDGPLCSANFDAPSTGPRAMWEKAPHKRALDFLWYGGALATAHRVGFTKYYALPERAIPARWREQEVAEQAQIDWLCENALSRLAFGTPGDIKRFWDAVTMKEAHDWVATHKASLVPVEVESHDGSLAKMLAPADIEQRLLDAPAPTSRLRILNPFDPAIRDRKRLEHLFGFAYRIEIFVPAAKRLWGYYVYPLLEGDRLVGRIEVDMDRRAGLLSLARLWPEAPWRWTSARQSRLESELQRIARFAGLSVGVSAVAPLEP